MRVAIVGAGWAGLAAAVTLAGRGVPVTVFESSRRAGGRARRVDLGGVELDNGQHILIGAYRATLGLMREAGADPEALLVRLPLELHYTDGFALKAARLPYPLNLAWGLLTARSLPAREAMRAASFLGRLRRRRYRVEPDRPVGLWLTEEQQEGRLRSHLWEPLCVSALNTPADRASAQVFANVLRDGLTGSRANSDLLIPKADLGKLFPDPAARYVRQHGGTVELGSPVRRIWKDAAGFRLDERPAAFDRVVIATGPQHAAALLQAFTAASRERVAIEAFEYEPIATCYLQYDRGPALASPMTGIAGGIVQWVFDRGRLGGPPGLVAAVISASGEHDSLPNETLARRVHEELARHYPGLREPRWTRVIAERRATFSCRPGLERPRERTAEPGLYLCGDYLDPAYPGTLESAVRSGMRVALALLEA